MSGDIPVEGNKYSKKFSDTLPPDMAEYVRLGAEWQQLDEKASVGQISWDDYEKRLRKILERREELVPSVAPGISKKEVIENTVRARKLDFEHYQQRRRNLQVIDEDSLFLKALQSGDVEALDHFLVHHLHKDHFIALAITQLAKRR